MDYHTLLWPLEVGDGFPQCGVAPQVGMIDPNSAVWPLQLR